MANTILKANQFRRVPSSGVCASNVKDGDSITFNSGSSLILEAGASILGVTPGEIVLATNVITASESGKTFFLSAVAGFESTLPTMAMGLRFRFIVATAPTSVGYTITGSPADKITGTVAANGAADTVNGIAASLADNVIFVANVALIGDWVEFYSDGVLWYVTGQVNTFAALTANG